MRRSGKTKIKMMRIGTSAICRHPGTTHITDDRKRKPPLRAEVKCRQLPSNHTRGGSASRPPGSRGGCNPVYQGIRRTPGLRREELATLAGISNDYYTRLERGKETHPSPQVISPHSHTPANS
jgi:hypothetical protein